MRTMKGPNHVGKWTLAAVLTFLNFTVNMIAAQPASPREQLQDMLGQLQKAPDDQSLREKIIKLVLTLDPPPAVPEDADKFDGRAEYAFKNAKNGADFADAAKEYEKASLVAPWAAGYYFNAGVAHEKAGNPRVAISQFRLYLLAAPDAQDARDVRKRIAGLEYSMEKEIKGKADAAEKQQQEELIVAERQRQTEAAKRAAASDISGLWWYAVGQNNEKIDTSSHMRFEVNGTEVAVVVIWDADWGGKSKGDEMVYWRGHVKGNKLTLTKTDAPVPGMVIEGTVSSDGQEIKCKETLPFSDPGWRKYTIRRK